MNMVTLLHLQMVTFAKPRLFFGLCVASRYTFFVVADILLLSIIWSFRLFVWIGCSKKVLSSFEAEEISVLSLYYLNLNWFFNIQFCYRFQFKKILGIIMQKIFLKIHWRHCHCVIKKSIFQESFLKSVKYFTHIFYKVFQWQYNKVMLFALWVVQNQQAKRVETNSIRGPI